MFLNVTSASYSSFSANSRVSYIVPSLTKEIVTMSWLRDTYLITGYELSILDYSNSTLFMRSNLTTNFRFVSSLGGSDFAALDDSTTNTYLYIFSSSNISMIIAKNPAKTFIDANPPVGVTGIRLTKTYLVATRYKVEIYSYTSLLRFTYSSGTNPILVAPLGSFRTIPTAVLYFGKLAITKPITLS